eukprot:GHVU01176890.1.p1 GENE.GHVU01176890.1~~GHVU01176890.1.p1  ORF type:complete len:134 (+),score=10.80 GHVU01176890.1:902-1303(+)
MIMRGGPSRVHRRSPDRVMRVQCAAALIQRQQRRKRSPGEEATTTIGARPAVLSSEVPFDMSSIHIRQPTRIQLYPQTDNVHRPPLPLSPPPHCPTVPQELYRQGLPRTSVLTSSPPGIHTSHDDLHAHQPLA